MTKIMREALAALQATPTGYREVPDLAAGIWVRYPDGRRKPNRGNEYATFFVQRRTLRALERRGLVFCAPSGIARPFISGKRRRPRFLRWRVTEKGANEPIEISS